MKSKQYLAALIGALGAAPISYILLPVSENDSTRMVLLLVFILSALWALLITMTIIYYEEK